MSKYLFDRVVIRRISNVEDWSKAQFFHKGKRLLASVHAQVIHEDVHLLLLE